MLGKCCWVVAADDDAVVAAVKPDNEFAIDPACCCNCVANIVNDPGNAAAPEVVVLVLEVGVDVVAAGLNA